jgi:hypothetical protein
MPITRGLNWGLPLECAASWIDKQENAGVGWSASKPIKPTRKLEQHQITKLSANIEML